MHRADKALTIISPILARPIARATAAVFFGLLVSAAWAQQSREEIVGEAARGTRLLSPPEVSFGASVFGDLDGATGPEGYTFAPQSPGDSDLGEQLILMPDSAYKPFSIGLIQQGIRTSNAALTEEDTFDDWYSRTELGFSYVPKIFNNTFGELSADYGFFRYSDNSELDFDSLEVSAGVIQLFPNLNDLSAWFSYNHLRILSGRGHKEIFTDHTLEIGLYQPVPVGNRNIFFGSYASEFSIDANPNFAQRHEHSLSVGWTFFPTDRLEFSAFYQFFVLDYRQGDRTDLLHNTGITLAASIFDGVDLVLSGTYAINDSNFIDGDYEVGDVGAALSIFLEF